jgi:hypothetical protein
VTFTSISMRGSPFGTADLGGPHDIVRTPGVASGDNPLWAAPSLLASTAHPRISRHRRPSRCARGRGTGPVSRQPRTNGRTSPPGQPVHRTSHVSRPATGTRSRVNVRYRRNAVRTRQERIHTLDSALGPNLQQITEEGKLSMTRRASSLSASLLERSDGQLAKLAWQVITLVALEEN